MFALQLSVEIEMSPQKNTTKQAGYYDNKFDETAWMEVANNGLVTATTIGLIQTRVLVGAARTLLPLDVPEGVP